MAMVENPCWKPQVSFLATVLLIITSSISVNNGQSEVTLSLNGVNIPSGGRVLVTDITEGHYGVTDGGLLCITDSIDCCRASDNPNGFAQGEWYFPNGSLVQILGTRYGESDIFYRNRDTRLVRLNRVGNPPGRGLFRCEVPNADGITVTLYVNIVDLPPATYTPPPSGPLMDTTSVATPTSIAGVSITSSGTATAGVFCCEVPDATDVTQSVCADIGEQLSLESSCTCSFDVGIAVGGLILGEGLIAAVAAVIVAVICWRNKSDKSSDFEVSANMAYGQVKQEDLGDVSGEYEDPDKLTRSGQARGGGGGRDNYESVECPVPYAKPEAPVYATADDTTNSGKPTV